MNETERDIDQPQGQDHIKAQHVHRFQWKEIHHSWIFWVSLLLMLAGIIYYIMSVGFVMNPLH